MNSSYAAAGAGKEKIDLQELETDPESVEASGRERIGIDCIFR